MTQFYPIRLVRLMTGETLVTGVGDSGKNNYVLERPMLLLTLSADEDAGQNQVSVVLKDWIDFTGDDYIFVRKEIVVCMVKPIRSIVADYMQAKMTSDIMDDMMERSGEPQTTVEDLTREDDGGGVAEEDEPRPDEFPGWGGDPDLT